MSILKEIWMRIAVPFCSLVAGLVVLAAFIVSYLYHLAYNCVYFIIYGKKPGEP